MTEIAAPRSSSSLASKLAAVRARLAAIKLATAILGAIGLFVLTLAVGILLDWLITDGLPVGVRAAILALNIAAVIAIIVRFAVIPIVFPPDDEQIALWIERETPTFQSRLISAVQLTREGALPTGAWRAMLGAMLRETESIAQPVDFSRVVKGDQLIRVAGATTLIVLLGLLAIAVWKETASDLLKRAFLVPGVEVPRKTRFDSGTGDMLVAKGDSVTLSAIARGYIPSSGTLVVNYADGGKTSQEFPIEHLDADHPTTFSRTLENVQGSFTYRIRIFDNMTPPHKVTAVMRPGVAAVECQQIYPAYTHLPPARRTTGDLSLLAGSRLGLTVKANKAVKVTTASDPIYNRVLLAGSDKSYPLIVDPADHTRLIAMDGAQNSIPLSTTPTPTTGLSIHLIDDLGMESKDSAVYRVDLVPDRPPTVRVTFPQKTDELITPQAMIPVGFGAADDFALGKLTLHYKIEKVREGDDKGLQGDGIKAEYFATANFTGHAITRNDAAVDFIWGTDAPMRGMPADHFSVRWTGVIVASTDGPTVFSVNADDAMKVYLDGKLVAERFHPSTAVNMKTGEPHDLKVEYVEDVNEATAQLLWGPPGQDPVVIPGRNYFTTRAAIGAAGDFKHGDIELDINPPNPKSLRGHYDWDVSKLQVPVGYVIDWWLEAQDTNDQTGPGKGESEHHQSHVVTEKQKLDELYSRLNDFDKQINDVATSEDELSNRLGGVIFEKKN